MTQFSVRLSRQVTDLLICDLTIEAVDADEASERAMNAEDIWDFEYHSTITCEAPMVEGVTKIEDVATLAVEAGQLDVARMVISLHEVGTSGSGFTFADVVIRARAALAAAGEG